MSFSISKSNLASKWDLIVWKKENFNIHEVALSSDIKVFQIPFNLR